MTGLVLRLGLALTLFPHGAQKGGGKWAADRAIARRLSGNSHDWSGA